MRKVAAASLFLFSTMAWSELPPPDIQRVINQADEQYSNCRGGTGGTDPDTNPYCIKGRELFENLEKLGWCYGHEGQYGYEKTWEPCKKPVEISENQKIDIDFNSAALDMYSTYMSYGNGVAAMFSKENECWKDAKTIAIANNCTGMTFAGAIIEAAFAREQGRSPAPNYQPQATKDRVIKQFEKHGFTEEQAMSALKYTVDNIGEVIGGLMNAGMN